MNPSLKNTVYSSALTAALSLAAAGLPDRAYALQPLEEFLERGQTNGLENRAAEATRAESLARSWDVAGRLLPRIVGQATEARDQYPALSPWGTIQDQWTTFGSLTASVPLVDPASWMETSEAVHKSDADDCALEEVRQETARRIALAYFGLVASEAMKRSYGRAQETARRNLEIAREKQAAGASTELEIARSRVEAAAADQGMVDAEQNAVSEARSLRSLCSLTPAAGVPDLVVDTREEETLGHWEAVALERSPAVREARARSLAAKAAADAAACAVLPMLEASFVESGSSVGDGLGHNEWHQASASLNWSFGADSVARFRERAHAAERARAEEALARQRATDSVDAAWQGVASGIARSRSAHLRLEAARLAGDLAEQGFSAGTGSQQVLIESQRDLLQAESDCIRADTDLLYSRAALRLAAGVPMGKDF